MGLPDDSTPENFFLSFFTRNVFGTLFYHFYPRNIFLPRFSTQELTRIERTNEQCLRPLFDGLPNHLYSNDYPLINKIISLIATDNEYIRILNGGNALSSAASQYLTSNSLREAISDPEIPEDVFIYILSLKANELMNLLNFNNTSSNVREFLQEYKQNHLFQELNFDDLNREIESNFTVNLKKTLPSWYNAKGVPIYTVRNIQVYKIEPSEYPAHQVSFEIQNSGNTDGFISLSSKSDGAWCIYSIPAKTSWKIKKIYDEKPNYIQIALNLSQNIPTSFNRTIIEEISATTSDTSNGQFAMNPQEFLPDPTEFIVDNEDPGFRLKSSEKKRISTLLNKKKEKTYIYHYYLHRFVEEKFPTRWTFYADWGYYYGNSIKSCVCKAAGKGDSHASWNIELPETGQYEIFIYTHSFQKLSKGYSEQYYTFTTGEGKKEFILKNDLYGGQWLSIGVYDLTAGENTITLSDKGETDQIIYADAVKWKLISK